jgi:hypothetical protein
MFKCVAGRKPSMHKRTIVIPGRFIHQGWVRPAVRHVTVRVFVARSRPCFDSKQASGILGVAIQRNGLVGVKKNWLCALRASITARIAEVCFDSKQIAVKRRSSATRLSAQSVVAPYTRSPQHRVRRPRAAAELCFDSKHCVPGTLAKPFRIEIQPLTPLVQSPCFGP